MIVALPVLPNFQDAFGPPVDLNDAYTHLDIPVNDDEDPETLLPPAQPTINNQLADSESREPDQSSDVRRSARPRKMTQRMIESIAHSTNNRAYSTYYEDMAYS